MRCCSSCNLVWPFVALVAVGGVGAWALSKYLHRTPTPSAGAVVVIVSGDTGGWIVPCGCTSNQSGGLPRRGSFVRGFEGNNAVVYADAGGAPGGTSDYQRLKFEAILRGEMALGLAAHNIGAAELDLGMDYLRDTAHKLQLPFVSANLRDSKGVPIGWPIRIVESNGKRIAFTGVLSKRYARPGVQLDEPRESLVKVIADANGRYDSLIVLAYVPEEELRALAAGLPEADAVIGGPTGQSIAPESVGPTMLAAATNKGKFIVQIAPPGPGGRWAGDIVELTNAYKDDAEQLANVKKFQSELAGRDFAASDTGFAPTLPSNLPADYRIAGSDSCKSCHAADCESWSKSKHSHAWQTLAVNGYHVDGYCQQCHTTGFGMPGGFVSAKRSPDRRDVGCESCHGPSQGHVANPKTRTPFAAKDQCVRCHDHENSPTFAYGSYWEKIRHGEKTVGRE